MNTYRARHCSERLPKSPDTQLMLLVIIALGALGLLTALPARASEPEATAIAPDAGMEATASAPTATSAPLTATTAPAAMSSTSGALQADPVCGSTERIECSAHAVKFGIDFAAVLMPLNAKFQSACAKHDYCYRYGFATYGKSKFACDDQFLRDMQRLCFTVNATDAATGGATFGPPCLQAANIFHNGVRYLGESSYKTTTSQRCEYEGKCPPGEFSTAIFKNCACAGGQEKRYDNPLKQFAYCKNTTACPASGLFSHAVGQYKGCLCPPGSPKLYHWNKVQAWCGSGEVCPNYQFSTLVHRGCACPPGMEKHYTEKITKSKAICRAPAPPAPVAAAPKYCPGGKFYSPTNHGCPCPPGTSKKFDFMKAWAQCK
jgi:hypothetical protein